MNISTVLNHFISDIYYKRGNPYRYYRKSKLTEFGPHQHLEALQLKKLRDLLAHHARNSPYYQKLLGNFRVRAFDIKATPDIQKLPVMSKSMVRDSVKTDMVADGRYTKNVSGGSTGEPTVIYSSKSHDEWNKAAVLRTYDWLGYRVGDRRMRLFAAPTQMGKDEESIKAFMFNLFANRRFIDASRLNPGIIHDIVIFIDRWRPKLITGYTSVLHQIARQMLENEQELGYDGLTIQNAAETLPGEIRATIERAFNARMFNHYGTREIGYIAHECPQRSGLHVHMEHLIVEVVDNDGYQVNEGSVGEVLITQLENYAMPVIRYKIGDLAVACDAACDCGRKLQFLGTVTGRSTDVIKFHDGSSITGLLFPHIFKDFKIESYQVYQREDHSIDVNIVVSSSLSPGEISAMVERLGDALGEKLTGLEIRIHLVDQIFKTNSGKLRTVISELT